jgi:hypothetical protein
MSEVLSGCAVRAEIQKEKAGPFILVTDDSGHWYVIPSAKRIRWAVWLESEDAELGSPPDYAQAVGGNPNLVEFTGYVIK